MKIANITTSQTLGSILVISVGVHYCLLSVVCCLLSVELECLI